MVHAPSDTVLLGYGLLAGAARIVVPPVLDLPLVRAVRGAMFDRLAQSVGVTLSAEARRVLVDLDAPLTGQGFTEQAIRWAAGRFLPGAVAMDVVRNVMRTYGAGALFKRYLEVHRPEPRDPVMDAFEAGRVQRAMRKSLHVLSVEQIRAVAQLVQATFQRARRMPERSMVQRLGDAVVSALADLPAAWVDVLDKNFARNLGAEGCR